MTVRILRGDCRDVLRSLPAESVHCVVTSPPYWGLRDYGCAGQIGLEVTFAAFVSQMLMVFREVHRVLRPDGTLWLNLGDSYATGTTSGRTATTAGKHGYWENPAISHRISGAADGLKPKDLVGIPWRVAFALQADGWWLRQDIIWCLSGGTWLYARTSTKVGPMMLKDLVRLDPATVELWNGEQWTRVMAWTKRRGRADAREIVLRSGERIGCTGNHVWPTARGEIKTNDLRRGDVIQTARLPTGDRPSGWLTPEAFWFAGLFLAEGSRSGDTIQIAGHVKEESRLARIRDLIAHYGGTARAYQRKGNCQNIHIDSIGISAVLQQLIGGRTAQDKHLQPRVWHYRDCALKEIANGYLEGDGHDDKSNSRIRLGFCRNYTLERDLRALAARLGSTLTLKPSFSKNRGKSFPSFRGEWRWERSGHANEHDRGEVMEVRQSRARQFWDITVADNPNLFSLASGVLTHNSKPNPMPESVTDRCTKAHEYLFLLSKSERYHYDAEAIKEAAIGESEHDLTGPGMFAPGQTPQRGNRKIKMPDGWDTGPGGHGSFHRQGREKGRTSGNKTHKGVAGYESSDSEEHRTKAGLLKISDTCYPMRNRRSVWEVATAPFSEAHFATFPPALIEPCIKAGCPSGGTVLDPFGGAGTTGLVADRLGRNAILIELNSEYAAMAQSRIQRDAGIFAEVVVE